MAHLQSQRLYHDADHNNIVIGEMHPASEQSVEYMLSLPDDTDDGETRSQWFWIRLSNGDLVFGCFPQDDAYFYTEGDHSA